MTCKCKNIPFGAIVTIRGGQSCCKNCGADGQKQLESTKWIYQGHSDGVDIFKAVNPFNCSTCGEFTEWHGEMCESDYDSEPFGTMRESVPVPRVVKSL